MGSIFKEDVLAGRVAFVTGGGSGICKTITHTLMAHGADTVIVGRKAERLQAAAEELSQATGRTCLPAPADVRDTGAVEAALDAALNRFGRLDIVINGAAGNFLAPAASLSYNGFKTVIEIDTVGTFNVSKAAFTKYLAEHGGVILNITATLHYAGTPMQVHPGAAKAAVDAMTRHLAVEWGPAGIRVNSLAPGPIADTEGMKRLLPDDLKEKMRRGIPLGRFGTSQDIADAALFLVSDAASYVSGSIMVVDGGAWMTTSSLHL